MSEQQAVPDGSVRVERSELEWMRNRVNTLANCTTRTERYQIGGAVKALISAMLAAAPGAPAEQASSASPKPAWLLALEDREREHAMSSCEEDRQYAAGIRDAMTAYVLAGLSESSQAEQAEKAQPDRDAAIRMWHKHCDGFSALHGTSPSSAVVDAMLEFAAAATHPAALAQPLTDEQIEPMFSARKAAPAEGTKDEWYWYAWGIEDGERTHGIGGALKGGE